MDVTQAEAQAADPVDMSGTNAYAVSSACAVG